MHCDVTVISGVLCHIIMLEGGGARRFALIERVESRPPPRNIEMVYMLHSNEHDNRRTGYVTKFVKRINT